MEEAEEEEFQEFIAKIFLDDISDDENRLIPWYFLFCYAKEEHNIELIPESHITRTEERICKYYEHMKHEFKDYMRIIDAGEFFEKTIKIEDYPESIHETYSLLMTSWNSLHKSET